MAVTSDRGQMLLIGAIVLAVLFVSLSFVLNGSIQTTSVSAEASDDVSASETHALQDATRRDVAGVLRSAIQARSSVSGQRTHVQENVSQLGQRYRQYYAHQDRIVDVTWVGATDDGSDLTAVTVEIVERSSRVTYRASIEVEPGDGT